jgi:SAM-dependent methyltransferase
MNQIGHDLFNYDDMYSNATENLWREVCAVDKVKNQISFYDLIPTISGMNLLEVGCGEGSIAAELSRNRVFQTYTGIEISRSGISAAMEKSIKNAEFIYLEASKIENFEFQSDVTLLCHVVEHLDNPRVLIMKAKEWSEYLLVEVPLEDNRRMSEDYDWNPVGHINKFKTATIKHLIQTCGWSIVRTKIYNPSRDARTFHSKGMKAKCVWLIKEVALKLNPRIASKFFTYHYVILAKQSGKEVNAN